MEITDTKSEEILNFPENYILEYLTEKADILDLDVAKLQNEPVSTLNLLLLNCLAESVPLPLFGEFFLNWVLRILRGQIEQLAWPLSPSDSKASSQMAFLLQKIT